jgi:hypothetical protein
VFAENKTTRVFKDSKSYTKHLKAKHHTSSDDLHLESPAHCENCISTDTQNHSPKETVFNQPDTPKVVSLQAKEWLEDLSDPKKTEGNLEYKILFKMFI